MQVTTTQPTTRVWHSQIRIIDKASMSVQVILAVCRWTPECPDPQLLIPLQQKFIKSSNGQEHQCY